MNGTISQILNKLPGVRNAYFLQAILEAMADTISTKSHMSAGLVIKGGGSTLVKTGAAAWVGHADGKRVTLAAATDMAALSGTVVNATFNVYAFFVDAAGALTSQMGTAGATLAAVIFPTRPPKKIFIGYTVINPTGAGNFVGGTTALDDVTVVPNAVHVSLVGGWDPTITI